MKILGNIIANFRKAINSNKGFTLIEFLVVLSIISVIIAIAIFTFRASTMRAQRIVCYQNQSTLQRAIESYGAGEQQYPNNLDELKPNYINVSFKFL